MVIPRSAATLPAACRAVWGMGRDSPAHTRAGAEGTGAPEMDRWMGSGGWLGFMRHDGGWGDREVTSPVCAGKSPSSIDTWPGRRSGCMIVIASILSSLAGLLLLAFLAASTVRL